MAAPLAPDDAEVVAVLIGCWPHLDPERAVAGLTLPQLDALREGLSGTGAQADPRTLAAIRDRMDLIGRRGW